MESAERQVKLLNESLRAGSATIEEWAAAERNRISLAGALNGDDLETARAKLRLEETVFKFFEVRLNAGYRTVQVEYEEAKLARRRGRQACRN